VIFRRRTIAPDGPHRFVVHLGDEERAVLRAVCQDLLSVLDDDVEVAPSLRRLFPSASADDPAVDEAYQALVHDDLLTSRREVLAAVADTAEDKELDREQVEQWMVGLNSVRLVLGTVLDVSEDEVPELSEDDPMLPAWAVYDFLGGVVDSCVRALSETLGD
jgi:DNA-binding transcriptional regulator YhcF (GntR family)